jgi:hypothetical protein
MSEALRLTEALIARRSVTPEDAGCLDIITARLAPLGFECERIDSGPDSFRVSNLWAVKRSAHANAKTLVFAGHTDVVPTGPLDQWTQDPFTPTHRNGMLYGRGSSDMKASLAAMVVAWSARSGTLATSVLAVSILAAAACTALAASLVVATAAGRPVPVAAALGLPLHPEADASTMARMAYLSMGTVYSAASSPPHHGDGQRDELDGDNDVPDHGVFTS